jgi:hypothetical protein
VFENQSIPELHRTVTQENDANKVDPFLGVLRESSAANWRLSIATCSRLSNIALPCSRNRPRPRQSLEPREEAGS